MKATATWRRIFHVMGLQIEPGLLLGPQSPDLRLVCGPQAPSVAKWPICLSLHGLTL